MNGWAAIFGAIALNSNKKPLSFSCSAIKTAHFTSLCGKYDVDFSELDKDYVEKIKNNDNTITHRGIKFRFVNTSIK